jgi:hypothetical protein
MPGFFRRRADEPTGRNQTTTIACEPFGKNLLDKPGDRAMAGGFEVLIDLAIPEKSKQGLENRQIASRLLTAAITISETPPVERPFEDA